MAAVVVGMAVQASVGFGFGFFAAPAALAAFRPATAVTLMLLLALLINALVLYTEGRERVVGARAVALMCAWSVPGIVAGALLVRHLDASALQVAIGVAIIVAAGLQTRMTVEASERPAHQARGTIAAGGLVAGTLTTATSLNGPAVVLTFTRAGMRGHVLRDSAAAAFIVLGLLGTVALTTIARAGHSLPSWPLLVALVPAVVVGHRLGAALFHRLDDERHRRLVLAAAMVAGVVSVVAGLL